MVKQSGTGMKGVDASCPLVVFSCKSKEDEKEDDEKQNPGGHQLLTLVSGRTSFLSVLSPPSFRGPRLFLSLA
jgi:hypothetical protein